LLAHREDPSFFAVGRALGLHHQTVQRCVERAVAEGPMAALDDRPRPGRKRTITLEAKAWLVSLACRKAKDLGYPHELWTILHRRCARPSPARFDYRTADRRYSFVTMIGCCKMPSIVDRATVDVTRGEIGTAYKDSYARPIRRRRQPGASGHPALANVCVPEGARPYLRGPLGVGMSIEEFVKSERARSELIIVLHGLNACAPRAASAGAVAASTP
jgi:hypothetical protein